MWDRHIREERIALERVLAQKCYWWILLKYAFLCIHIQGAQLNIKLPLPSIFGNSKWHDEWQYKARNEAEIKRVKDIWNQFISLMKEKIQRIEAGETTALEEFKDGIFFEDGKYGLKYGGSWN